jgi:hypothetical protein
VFRLANPDGSRALKPSGFVQVANIVHYKRRCSPLIISQCILQSPDPVKPARKTAEPKRGRQEEAPLKKKRARGEKVERSGEKARKKHPTWEDFWAKVMPLCSVPILRFALPLFHRLSTEPILILSS